MSKNKEKNKEDMQELGQMMLENSKRNSKIHLLSIIGEIEGHELCASTSKTTKYEHVIPSLAAIEDDPEIQGVLILINTIGGDVESGLAIAEMIASLSKPTVSLVLGGGHSIGVPLAVSAKRSFIVPSATMTIHPVRTSGLVLGVPQSFRALRDMQKRISDFICRHSRIEPRKLEELMMRPDEMATDVGSVLDGNEAVACGLIDEVGGLAEALAALRKMEK